MADLVTGVHQGVVVDDADEQGIGRLRVDVPTVTPGAPQWAMPCVPFAGAKRGVHWTPRTDERVWVAYEGGQPSRPVWLGGLWLPGDLASEDATPGITVLRTAQAWVSLDEETGTVTIENQGGASITMTSTDITLSAGTVTIKAGGRLIEPGAASMSVNHGALEVS